MSRFSSSKDTNYIGLGPSLVWYDLILIKVHLQRLFSNEVTFTGIRASTSTCHLRGHNLTHNKQHMSLWKE